MAADYPRIALSGGTSIPQLGFGTFLSKEGEVKDAVRHALKTGYRHIDCATVYSNEKEIGEVFNEIFSDPESGITRADVFVTSKLRSGKMHPDEVQDQLKNTLADLQLSYLDLYLIHQAVPTASVDGKTRPRRDGFSLKDTWQKMEECQQAGLTKAIGVSNFSAALLNDVLNYATIPPAINQIERHPYLQQLPNVEFNKSNGVEITAYAPLGAPGLKASADHGKGITPLLQCEEVAKIAAKHEKTPGQVLIRWALECGTIAIPKSTNPARIEENFGALSFALDDEDLAVLASLDRGVRYFEQDWTGCPMFH